MSKWRERERPAPRKNRSPSPNADKRNSMLPNTADTGDKAPLRLDTVMNVPHSASTVKRMERIETYEVSDPDIIPDWALDFLNASTSPIKLDPYSLNEARLACREAMTLITEEAARLVDHPELAYANFDSKTKMTKMKRPVYAYPETLKERLPVFIRPPPLTRWQKVKLWFTPKHAAATPKTPFEATRRVTQAT